MSSRGSLMFVLHAHLPFVNHPSTSSFLEENWFFEAVAETYIPIILMLERLSADGIRPGITLSVSPTLGAMLENEELEEKLLLYLESRIELLESESERCKDNLILSKTVAMYNKLYYDAYDLMHKYSGDLITPLKSLQHDNQIEIITTSATHAVLPLLIRPEAVRAQVSVAADDYLDRFNTKASGFWLPECAYEPGLNSYLKLSGFNYTFTESHSIENPQNDCGVHVPYFTTNKLGIFARDASSSREVWSAKFGYPGDPVYREFYRDFGYDGDLDYIKPYLGEDGTRRPLGLKYYRITDSSADLSKREFYDPDEALARTAVHAENFLSARMAQIEEISSHQSVKPLIVSCYDAELFGHWWFEGPAFLENVIRRIRKERLPLQFVTPAEYLKSCQEPKEITPNVSSWGEKGFFEPWLNSSNDYLYKPEFAVTDKMIDAANRFKNQDLTEIKKRVLNQAAREVLLSQSSDWAFLIYINSHSSYAKKRFADHVQNALKLLTQVIENKIDEQFLTELEHRNNIFPRIDFKIFSSVTRF